MTRAWNTERVLAFDVETTGLNVEEDRIVSAALVEAHPRGLARVLYARTLNPGIPIPPAAAAVHGITTERAEREGGDPRRALADLIAMLEANVDAPLVAYNAPFDLTMLDRELRRHDLPPLILGALTVIDPLVIDRAVDAARAGRRRLQDVAAHHGIPSAAWHGALADATAAASVAYALAARHPSTRVPARTLHEQQIKWHAKRARPGEVWPLKPLEVTP